MKKDATIIIGTLCLIMLAICLSQPKAAFAKNANEPCPCEDEYKSEPGYDLYKQATKDWKAKKWQKAVEKYQKIIEKYTEIFVSPNVGQLRSKFVMWTEVGMFIDDRMLSRVIVSKT